MADLIELEADEELLDSGSESEDEEAEESNTTPRHVCFTLYKPYDLDNLLHALALHCGGERDRKKGVRYIVFQQEVGARKKRIHLQGYVEAYNPHRWPTGWKRLLFQFGIGNHVHLKPRRGTREQAQAYCKKEATRIPGPGNGPWEFGLFEAGGQGKQSELREAAASLLQHRNLSRLQPHVLARHSRGLRDLLYIHAPRRDYTEGGCRVYWFYGPGGTGKSYTATKLFPGHYRKNPFNIWFDNYNGQGSVIIDDYDPTVKPGIGLAHFKLWFDVYDYEEQVKGAFVPLAAKTWIVTSNYDYLDLRFATTQENRAAWTRRITNVYHFKSRNDVALLKGNGDLVNALRGMGYIVTDETGQAQRDREEGTGARAPTWPEAMGRGAATSAPVYPPDFVTADDFLALPNQSEPTSGSQENPIELE